MRAGPDSPFPRRPSISDATADWMRRRPQRPKHKCANGVRKAAGQLRTLRRSKRLRSQLIRRRVPKRVNQSTEGETRCEIRTEPSQLTQGLQQEQTERTEMKEISLLPPVQSYHILVVSNRI